jgi:hypothetical protein
MSRTTEEDLESFASHHGAELLELAHKIEAEVSKNT